MEPPAPAPQSPPSAPPRSTPSPPAAAAPKAAPAVELIALDPFVRNPTSVKITPDSITHINIFDFDGTLFRSPTPSFQLWQKESIGKLKSEPAQGGLGWYQDVLTLSAPYIPANPDDKWWIASVLAEVQRSISSPSALTVLLTGRTVAYLSLISALLERKGLCFDYTLLKPLGNMRTFEFKRSAIHQLLKTYTKTGTIHIYEDREEHGERFRELLTGLCSIKGEVKMISDNDSVLPPAQELELVRTLLARYGTGQLEMHEVAEYSCVRLDSPSHHRLKALFPGPPNWHYRAHHLTLNLGPLHAAAGATVGTEVAISIVGVGKSDKAYAVKCLCPGAKSVNAIPHITIAFAPEGAAKDSNDIKEWREATEAERIELKGVVCEMKKWVLSPVKRPVVKTPGINIGALVRTVHPTAEGKAIGELVMQVKNWLKDNSSASADEAAITTFLKTLRPPATAPSPPKNASPSPSAASHETFESCSAPLDRNDLSKESIP